MRVRVKFCGMTRQEDLDCAAEMGADAVGLVFVPGTPRCLQVSRARELLRGLPPLLARVGVFADEDPMRVRRVREDLGLTAVQLHGSESPGHCAAVGGVRIKTFRVREDWDAAAMGAYDCEACLLEAPLRGALGGGGVAFDWERIRGGVPGRRIILAGGLTPENVGRAIEAVRPYAVDVSSGIESVIGVKDRDRMKDFIQAVRESNP
ncbi:MAG: phosphoribosylanthranilate isomerase [Acidobacteria bacterium]|nr:phosphoribosylanthranilate isomerase [Acidobacteriota bacterium]